MIEEELKGKIAELILKGFNKNFKFIELADEILDIPEIQEALDLYDKWLKGWQILPRKEK